MTPVLWIQAAVMDLAMKVLGSIMGEVRATWHWMKRDFAPLQLAAILVSLAFVDDVAPKPGWHILVLGAAVSPACHGVAGES